MPKIELDKIVPLEGSSYPPPFHESGQNRSKLRLGDAGGLTDFGVNLVTLPPGNWSSQRHWHLAEDEFVYVLSGEVTLVTDAGEQLLTAGACAAFPKMVADGHHLINKSDRDVVYLEVGTRSPDDECSYPDIDLFVRERDEWYVHKDGTPYIKPAK